MCANLTAALFYDIIKMIIFFKKKNIFNKNYNIFNIN